MTTRRGPVPDEELRLHMPHKPHKPSVLVVDDSSDGREMLTEYLVFHGFHVTQAQDGREAIAVARRIQPDVILMDLSMPVVDGWDATRQLKADPLTKNIIIIAVSAHAFRHEQESARVAGCDAVIAKPYDLTALTDALGRVGSEGLAVFKTV
jgi:two-component system, cell cycle response regulator DivK